MLFVPVPIVTRSPLPPVPPLPPTATEPNAPAETLPPPLPPPPPTLWAKIALELSCVVWRNPLSYTVTCPALPPPPPEPPTENHPLLDPPLPPPPPMLSAKIACEADRMVPRFVTTTVL